MLKSISRLDFLILGLLAEIVSRRSMVRLVGVGGTLEGEELSVIEARRRRTGEVSAGDLADAIVALVTEERRVVREGSTLSSSMLRRSGDGVFGESPRFSALSTLILR
jgi:hypothetical protein